MSTGSDKITDVGLAPHESESPQKTTSSKRTTTPPTEKKSSRAGHGIGILGMIWAEDRARVLGANGGMLWRVPADFKHFKQTTMGWPIIMGRASFEALGGTLPGRRNIVLTRRPEALAGIIKGITVETADSIETALRMCAGTEQVWITGGGGVYREVMDADIADLLVVSELDLTATIPPGANVTLAPPIDPEKWQLDTLRSETQWRPVSGDGTWRVRYYIPR